jgi:predicted MFS family arabinose efflux permease
MSRAGVQRINLGMAAFSAATSIPISFFFYVLPAVLRQAGHSAEVIGLVALVYLPYALRVLWAPPVDHIAAGRAARYRALAFATLAAAILGIVSFAAVNPREDLAATLSIATLVFAFLATGLTAFDGYVLATLGIKDRERISAFQAGGFTLGAIVVGVGAIAADGLSWTVTVMLLAIATTVLAVPMLILPKTAAPPATPDQDRSPHGLWGFLKRPVVRRRIVISMLAHGGLGLPVGYLPVLQVDAGLSPGQIGLFGAVGSNICGLAAAVATGALVARFGSWRTLAAVSVAGLAIFVAVALLHAQLNGPTFAVSVALVVMALGYSYAVPYRALVLTICDVDNGATQAALLTCFDFVIALLAASVAGVIVGAIGLTGLFGVSAAACCAGALIAVRALGRPDDSPLLKSAQVLP